MKRAWAGADMIELRMDRMGKCEYPDHVLAQLLRSRKGPVLVTNRRKEEGGFFAGRETQRIGLLKRAVTLGAEMVDIELGAGKRAISSLQREIAESGGRTKLVVSYHDFSGTPADGFLRRKVESCARAGADIIKVVTMAVQKEDNVRVLKLIPLAQSLEREIVAFCMGDLGKISRLALPLLGGAFTFAALMKGGESAPGQMTAAAMRSIWRQVGETEEAQ